MSKNTSKNQVLQQTPPEAAPQAKPAEPGAAAGAEATRAQLWTFALAVVLVLVTARVLDVILPGIPERLIERWLMLGFGVFLVAFLAWLK